eukprot:CAMPEP_0197486248 /NCGR_PEP_ID=MMETSP1311-20131121/1186_1 /TAXON_ID=464262 /ORGANISM="Genus nov. species nov., Strain RCC856" /LENGTH=89 /DNA_ID=CAMNT_0043029241 /DNA_START=261 /DNA_END=527 /DNA_ORIENTATION=+
MVVAVQRLNPPSYTSLRIDASSAVVSLAAPLNGNGNGFAIDSFEAFVKLCDQKICLLPAPVLAVVSAVGGATLRLFQDLFVISAAGALA